MSHLILPDLENVPRLGTNGICMGFNNTGGLSRKEFIIKIRNGLENGDLKLKKNLSKGVNGFFDDIIDKNGVQTSLCVSHADSSLILFLDHFEWI